MTFENAFHEIAVLLAIATIAGTAAVRLRQPLVVAFIAVGVAAGPSALDLVRAGEEIHLLAELGIALVLFVVGLKLDVRVVQQLGRVALITGAIQISGIVAFGLIAALAAGLSMTEAAYVGIALAFSSTIIVVKLLSERREIDDLHGRLAVGLLIVQDLVVIAVMIALTGIGASDTSSPTQAAALTLAKGALLVGGVVAFSRWGLRPVLARINSSPELLVLGAIGWAVGLAAAADLLGFSIEIGAFIAGVVLASTDYRDAIGGRLVPLRDFLLVFFFLDLGTSLDLGTIGDQLILAAILSAGVLIGKPLLVTLTLSRLGYTGRVGLLTGIAVSQISEFSLIIAALGLSLGHIDDSTVALITAIALITISISSYAMTYERALSRAAAPLLARLDARADGDLRDEPDEAPGYDVIICGAGRLGGSLLEPLADAGHRVLVVDFDPLVIDAARNAGHDAIYGDVENPELPHALPLAGTRWVVCTVPRPDVGLGLLHALEHEGFDGDVILSAHDPRDAELLMERGATHVLRPYVAAATQAAEILGDPPPAD